MEQLKYQDDWYRMQLLEQAFKTINFQWDDVDAIQRISQETLKFASENKMTDKQYEDFINKMTVACAKRLKEDVNTDLTDWVNLFFSILPRMALWAMNWDLWHFLYVLSEDDFNKIVDNLFPLRVAKKDLSDEITGKKA